MILVASSSHENNLGKLHPVSIGKLLTKNFSGIVSITPADPQRIKVLFESIIKANTCISSPILVTNNLVANIPSSLLYCFGVIRLDVNITDKDFWEGHESPSKIVSFR